MSSTSRYFMKCNKDLYFHSRGAWLLHNTVNGHTPERLGSCNCAFTPALHSSRYEIAAESALTHAKASGESLFTFFKSANDLLSFKRRDISATQLPPSLLIFRSFYQSIMKHGVSCRRRDGVHVRSASITSAQFEYGFSLRRTP